MLWKEQRFAGCFVEKSLVNKVKSDLYSCTKQSAACQALHIVKSQRKKKCKVKPVFNKQTLDLDSRFIEIIQDEKSSTFDLWVKFKTGDRNTIYLPTKKHKQFLKFVKGGWALKKSGRLRILPNNHIMLDVYFEKEMSQVKCINKVDIGLDIGYKKLAVLSNKQVIGKDLEKKINKITRKLQGSKAFKRALIERNDYINREIKKIPFDEINTLVVEDLKNVKYKSKGKISKVFMNKLQRWVYSYLLK